MTPSEWAGLVIAAALITLGLRWLVLRALALWWLYFVFRPELRRWLDKVFGPEERS